MNCEKEKKHCYKKKISKERLNEIFKYDESGRLIWNVKRQSVKLGSFAGSIKTSKKERRCCVWVDGKEYYNARLIWIFHFDEIPEGMLVDHIDRNTLNDKIENLRLVNLSQNKINSIRSTSNFSSYKGVSYNTKIGKWRAQITIQGNRKYIGYFESEEDARIAYCKEAMNDEVHREYNPVLS